jgi:stage II sporulation protein GA (sporulation sigma-E factor processing peptidase)
VTLYADILLMVNCVMNSLILWVTAKLMRKRVSPLRIAGGGLSMALLHGILLLTVSVHIHASAASVLILAVGIFVTLRPNRPKPFFFMMGVAYAASFTVGGLGMGLFYLTDLPYAISVLSKDLTGVTRVLPWYLPVVCVLSVYLCIKAGLFLLERLTVKRQILCPVRVFVDENAVCFNALIDTGHNLLEPISKAPVIVAEFEQVKVFMPESWRQLFRAKKENDLSGMLQRSASAFDARLRMIPFTSLGRTHGMLIGFRPDRVQVGEPATCTDAIIGIYNHPLTRDGRYKGLISPELCM